MPIETDFDRSIVLADFGEKVRYSPDGLSSYDIMGIFDNVYEAVDAGGSVPFAMSQPRLTVKTSDVVGISEGDTIHFRDLDYVIRVVMADGTGMTELVLEAA
jgi:hypothetical protein